jgi:DNA repair protein RadC
VDPKLVFRSALLLGASNIILAHNHPNGKTTPSSHDIALTGKLSVGGRVLNLGVLDHIIWTKKAHVSLREEYSTLFEAEENPATDS